MGLEATEIVIATEETFGIDIPNEAAARILTPAELVEYVASHVGRAVSDTTVVLQAP